MGAKVRSDLSYLDPHRALGVPPLTVAFAVGGLLADEEPELFAPAARGRRPPVNDLAFGLQLPEDLRDALASAAGLPGDVIPQHPLASLQDLPDCMTFIHKCNDKRASVRWSTDVSEARVRVGVSVWSARCSAVSTAPSDLGFDARLPADGP